MSDPIDRKQAIDALEKAKAKDPFDRYEKQNIGLDWGIEAIKSLPSAQSEITLCSNCKHFAGERMYCAHNILVPFSHFYCYYAERGEDETD